MYTLWNNKICIIDCQLLEFLLSHSIEESIQRILLNVLVWSICLRGSQCPIWLTATNTLTWWRIPVKCTFKNAVWNTTEQLNHINIECDAITHIIYIPMIIRMLLFHVCAKYFTISQNTWRAYDFHNLFFFFLYGSHFVFSFSSSLFRISFESTYGNFIYRFFFLTIFSNKLWQDVNCDRCRSLLTMCRRMNAGLVACIYRTALKINWFRCFERSTWPNQCPFLCAGRKQVALTALAHSFISRLICT